MGGHGRTLRTCALCIAAAWLGGYAGAPSAWSQLRVVTYNTGTGQADNPATGQTARAGIGTILQAIGAEAYGPAGSAFAKPIDVLLLQEQHTLAISTQSFVNVLNGIYGAGVYARGIVQGATSDPNAEAGRPGVVYNTQTVQLLEEVAFGAVGTADGTGPTPAQQPRSTLRYKFKPVGYDDSAIFYAYNSHYKSDTGTGNNNRRLAEAQSIRANADALGEGVHAIYAGDFNIQTSSGTAYQHLLSAGNGQAFDPVNRPGSWHDNATFADLFTQAPATASQYAGQTVGGMDDRFDFQLITAELQDNAGMSYLPGTYHALANNGSVPCCNSPITAGTGQTPAVRTALMQASDHLPVIADYMLPAKLGVQVTAVPQFIELGASVAIDVMVSNVAPAVHVAGVDQLAYALGVTGSLAGGGMGLDAALGGGNLHQVLLDSSTLGAKNGAITVTATSLQTASPLFSLPVSFQVISAFLAADFNRDGAVNETDLGQITANFGLMGAAKAQGDADADGDVDGNDFTTWQRQLGQLPAGVSALAAVPEPAAAMLLAAAWCGLAATRRKRAGRRLRGRG
ncbi:MAG TPA: hypothetical protein VEQ85_15205 [Lacipirellulaceae bacterium]|nr:hypothetical protein [Lacipirellulaceae bacterium]